MLETKFRDKLAFNIYTEIQKIRMEKGYLTRSEREQLKQILDKNYKPTFIKDEPFKGKKIVTNINELHIPCQKVEKGEDISQILKDLKDTLDRVGGLGLSANQIGINKAISYLRFPRMNDKTKKIEMIEYYIINPKIQSKISPFVMKEKCLSLPGLEIQTMRYRFIVVYAVDEHFKEKTILAKDLEAIVLNHEIDHLYGKTIIDRKYFDRNRRK